MTTAWRLVKSRFAATAFDGEGARLNGARWNSPGTPVAYAADSPALAVLEVLAHLGSARHLDAYAMVSAEIPDDIIERLERALLPEHWRAFPPPPATQALGDAWATSGRSAVLAVPSVLVPHSTLFLINPRHPAATRIAIGVTEPYGIEPRLHVL